MKPAMLTRDRPVAFRPAPMRLAGVGAALLVLLGASSARSQPAAPAGAGTAPGNLPPLVQWGPVAVRPHASYSYAFADGLRGRSGRVASSYIERFSPGFLLELGKTWSFDYTPTFVNYTSPYFSETVEHTVRMDGVVTRPSWGAKFGQQYKATLSPLLETGRQSKRQQSTTAATFVTMVGRNASFEVAANQKLMFVEAFADAHEWSVAPALSYRFSKWVSAGMGMASGYLLLYGASDMVYLRPSLNVVLQSKKTTLTTGIGGEEWHFVSGPEKPRRNFNYQADLKYALTSTTLIGVTASRGIGAGYLAKTPSTNLRWAASIEQRFFRWLQVQVEGGEQRAKSLPVRNPLLARQDRLRSYSGRVSAPFLQRGLVTLTYEKTENQSSNQQFAVASDEIRVEVSYRY